MATEPEPDEELSWAWTVVWYWGITWWMVSGVVVFVALLALALVAAGVGGIVGVAIAGKVGGIVCALFCGWCGFTFAFWYGVGENEGESGCYGCMSLIVVIAAISAFGKQAEK